MSSRGKRGNRGGSRGSSSSTPSSSTPSSTPSSSSPADAPASPVPASSSVEPAPAAFSLPDSLDVSEEALLESSSKPVRWVVLEGLVAMQILKHAKDFLPTCVAGQLLGLDIGDRLEVTYSFPLMAAKPGASAGDDGAEEETVESPMDYTLEMLRHLRQVNTDNNLVGWYQTTYLGTLVDLDRNSRLDAQLIETQYNYQSAIGKAVCIIYDPYKSSQGPLALRAYRLSDAFMKFFADQTFSTEKLHEFAVGYASVFEELQLVVRNAHLIEGLLAELAVSARRISAPRLDLPQASFMEKTLEQMTIYTDLLLNDLNGHHYWQKRRNVQLAQQAKRQHLRRELNANRKARGLPPLPDDTDSQKIQPEPSRLDSLLLSTQIELSCSQLNAFAGQAFGKLFLLDGLEETFSSNE